MKVQINDGFKAQITLGSITLTSHQYLTGTGEGASINFTLKTPVTQFVAHIEIRDLENPETWVYAKYGGSYGEDLVDYQGHTIDNSTKFLLDVAMQAREYLRNTKFDWVTDDQFYEVMYQIYKQFLLPLGFNNEVLQAMLELETEMPKKDTLGILRACMSRKEYPDWIRNSLGNGTKRPHSVLRHIGKNGKR